MPKSKRIENYIERLGTIIQDGHVRKQTAHRTALSVAAISMDQDLAKLALRAGIYITHEMVTETPGLIGASSDDYVMEIESAAMAVALLFRDGQQAKSFDVCCQEMAVTVSTKKPLPNYGRKLQAFLKLHV